MKNSVLLIGFLLVFHFNGRSQQKRLDSLLRLQENHRKEDSSKVMLLIELMREYRKLQLRKERFQYAEAAIALGEKIKVLSPLPPVYNSLALYYEGISEFEKSIVNYERAIAIAELSGDKKSSAEYSLNYGTVYHTLADYPRALTLYQKAANYFIDTGNEDDAANCFINMGEVYKEFPDQSEKAISYFNKALLIFQKAGISGQRGVAECYLSIGNTLLMASDLELSRLHINPDTKYLLSSGYFDKAFEISKVTHDSSLQAEVNNEIGKSKEALMKFDEAISNYQNALNIYSKSLNRKSAAQSMLNLGRIYRKKKEFPLSLHFLQMALNDARQMKVIDLQKDALFNLSGVHENLQQLDSAYFYYRHYIMMRDSIFNNEKQKELTRKQLQFEFRVKEREYLLNQQLADNRIKEQELFFIQQKQLLDLRNKQVELINREKEIQKLNYLKKQSELETEKKLKIYLVSQKEAEKKLQTKNSDEKISEQQAQIRSEKKITFSLTMILLILSGAAIIIFRSNQRNKKLNTLVSAQKEKLVEMGKVKDKIFTIVSHDIKTPVNNLVAFSSLLVDGPIEQERLMLYFDQIKNTLSHTTSLMDNLLNWAASQMEGFTPVIEKLLIQKISIQAIKSMELACVKKEITIRNLLVNESESAVTGDRNMTELIIRNLLSNAIKFSPHGGIIELSSEENINSYTLYVKDSGLGIPESKIQKINSKSSHTLESTFGTEREKGTGLGLMLCKDFAAIMKGSIQVKSKLGEGSVFSVIFQLAEKA